MPDRFRANRDQIFAIYEHLVRPIVRSIARMLPSRFDPDDLEQIGRLALLDAAAGFEKYVRMRVRGAILDAVRGPNYTAALQRSIDECPDIGAPNSLDDDIDRERKRERQRLRLEAAIAGLPAKQAEVVQEMLTGIRPGQVAERSDCSIRTIQRLTRPGFAALRLALAA